MRFCRSWLYCTLERDFYGFKINAGKRIRDSLKRTQITYIKRTAPVKYYDVLIPKTEIDCKRKVMDTDYLARLHQDSVELVATDPIQTITETGVKTQSGREIHWDAIMLANGLKTGQILHRLEVYGQGGISLNGYVRGLLQHTFRSLVLKLTTKQWKRHCDGAAQAYHGSCVSSFPNFFIMMGPNTAAGHLSVVFSTECQINFTLHFLRPVLKEEAMATAISVVPNAEKRDNA
ncbi:hypothetical protein AYO20_10813 [Fonsecaea nubica]|uniref:Uncharacterized protein n=1 Tax=Fonsecaea nubica TaxID=856822 RepID=A0A178C4T7_9EURO|nr:hypothetical protein AYO20_10813 [Fonsecaea nubica]OAL23963.1 hypothetical protein AYO20_10813 [Fonsecaea nubica]